jgi:hypothetical protein
MSFYGWYPFYGAYPFFFPGWCMGGRGRGYRWWWRLTGLPFWARTYYPFWF